MHFHYEYYLTLFLIYNRRRCQADWRNKGEEEAVKMCEENNASKAADLMPDSDLVLSAAGLHVKESKYQFPYPLNFN